MKRWLAGGAVLLALFWILLAPGQAQDQVVKVGSKAFPESWILGDALTRLARKSGMRVEHHGNLGATEIIYQALRQGSIDVYPEYTGTIAKVFLKDLHNPTQADILTRLAGEGIGMSYSLGFSDSYALAVTQETARTHDLKTLSDLAAVPGLRFGLNPEFVGRRDGWPGLVQAYGFKPAELSQMQHQLAYTAISAGKVEVVDVYTTDPEIEKLNLAVLEDDLHFFPPYDAVLLYRADLPQRAPRAWAEMLQLVGRVSVGQMIHANRMVAVEGKTSDRAAAWLLENSLGSVGPPSQESRGGWDWSAVAANAARHLQLVGTSLSVAILVGIPLGILASRSPTLSALTLSAVGLLQTIPSLALLAFLVPQLGVGPNAALVALFLYSLLPIVRNTCTGLTTIPGNLAEAAEALGLSPGAQLWRIRLPMASPSILAGIKTSAVINVGTATLAALVGGGGLGQPILQGIALIDTSLLLQGALPAAGLALLVQFLFDGLERVVVPRGLRL